MEKQKARPVGEIVIHDKRGYAYLPKILREEIGVKGKDRIPFYIDANCVLMVRKEADLDEILAGLEILKKDLLLRAGRLPDEKSKED